MLVTILREFPYAADGIHARPMLVGAVEEIHDDLIPGLVAEGWVVASGAEATLSAFRPAPDEMMNVERRTFPVEETVAAPPSEPVAASEPEPAPVLEAAPDPAPADAYPHLTPAQEVALDRDGDKKPGGAPKGGNRRKAR